MEAERNDGEMGQIQIYRQESQIRSQFPPHNFNLKYSIVLLKQIDAPCNDIPMASCEPVRDRTIIREPVQFDSSEFSKF